MSKQQISYFDTTSKLLKNLENCTDKNIDMDFVKESLKTIINIMQTQNSFIEYLIQIDDNMEIVSTDSQIVNGMICYIRNKQKFGKIFDINHQDNKYSLKVLGTNDILTVSKKDFNI